MATATKRTTALKSTTTLVTDMSVLGARIADNVADDINSILDAGETDRIGPLVIAIDFMGYKGSATTASVDALFTREELDAWPVVGTRSLDKDGKPTGINNPDITKVTKQMTIGGSREVDHSQFDDLAEASQVGIEIQTMIGKCKERMKQAGLGNQDEIQQDLDRWNKRDASFKAKVKKTAAYIQQSFRMEQVKDTFRFHLQMVPATDSLGAVLKDGDKVHMVPSRSPKPIKVWDVTPEGKGIQFISLGQFLGLDIDAAVEKDGGTWKSIMAVEDTGATERQLAKPLAWSSLETTIASINRLLSTDGAEKTITREVAKAETGKVFAWELMELARLLGKVEAVCEPGYDLVERERSEAKKKEAAERALRTASN